MRDSIARFFGVSTFFLSFKKYVSANRRVDIFTSGMKQLSKRLKSSLVYDVFHFGKLIFFITF
tara:strand:+ start:1397 stop:1585 length:189 start_codon:yes stop_codon:yes gene_type:complete